MNKAYLILAHKNASQLYRLIKTLNDDLSYFFVHIDKRSGINEFSSLIEFGEKIQFVPRVETRWASFGLVEAVLNGLRSIKKSSVSISHIILLSGQDYPIKSNEQITDFLKRYSDRIFIEHFRLPDHSKWKPAGGLYRVNKYFLGLKLHERYLAKAMNFSARFLPFIRRKPLVNMQAYAGSTWWIINMSAADYILNFVDKNPGYTSFHKFTFASDEVFFHMILLNASDELVSSAIINNDKRFIKWENLNSSHPVILNKENLVELQNSEALFARKFDLSRDAEILDLIDLYCLSQTVN